MAGSEIADTLQKGLKLINEGIRVLSAGPADWYIGEAHDMIELLFTRFCPWHVGDQVMIVKPIDFEERSYWKAMAHFLHPGAVGRVTGVGVSDGHFTANVVFDNETWIDREGVAQPVSQRHAFGFGESYLALYIDRPSTDTADAADTVDSAADRSGTENLSEEVLEDGFGN